MAQLRAFVFMSWTIRSNKVMLRRKSKGWCSSSRVRTVRVTVMSWIARTGGHVPPWHEIAKKTQAHKAASFTTLMSPAGPLPQQHSTVDTLPKQTAQWTHYPNSSASFAGSATTSLSPGFGAAGPVEGGGGGGGGCVSTLPCLLADNGGGGSGWLGAFPCLLLAVWDGD
eukprot:1152557-Pelagomonas_calceolata.AAC.1